MSTISRRPRQLWLALMLLITLAFGAVAAIPASAQDTATDSDLSVADVAARANPAVVTIYTYAPTAGGRNLMPVLPGQDGDAAEEQPLGTGSGWIYDEAGHVVTNAHVVEGAERFTVRLYDGTEVEATLVGADPFQDVAVLQLELEDGQQVPGVATVGDSSAMRAGDPVVAIGTPLGEFANSVSDGIIGGLDRSLDTGLGYRLANLIQHDADLSSGNSGGPLLNMQGEVIGMNVAVVNSSNLLGNGSAVSSGLNFAIDGNTVVSSVERIIAAGDDITYPYLGIQGRETPDGQLVAAVEPGSPADEAGVQAGDIITAVDDQELGEDLPLMNALFSHQPGDTVQLTVDRDGQTVTLSVTLGERPH